MSDLLGRGAIVCGASQGIGRACAHALAERGASVTVVARTESALETVRGALGEISAGLGFSAEHRHVVADFDDLEATRERVQAHLAANGPVQILVNNAGGPPGGPIFEAEPEAFRVAIGRHLLVNQTLVQLVVPGMKETGYGRIVNVVSTSVKQPIPGLGVSNATRGAVASWAKTLAGELAPHGITVNNVLPGATRTGRLESLVEKWAGDRGVSVDEMISQLEGKVPMRRFGEPSEIAAVAAFFASPAASYVTGTSLQVDGGRTECL